MKTQYFKPPLGEVSVKVWGALACFTRPEFKVERVSYPVITPSAARGILEAILFKPEFSYAVTHIEVLRPLRFVSIRRNEVQKVVDLARAKEKWMTGEEPVEHLLADIKGRYKEDKEVKQRLNLQNPLLTQEENCPSETCWLSRMLPTTSSPRSPSRRRRPS
jgi:CRISPR-associated Cas5-like protein